MKKQKLIIVFLMAIMIILVSANEVKAATRVTFSELENGRNLYCIAGGAHLKDSMEVRAKRNVTTTVNGEIRQQAKLEQMLFKPDAIIEFVSQYITLQEGDIIFTGTPSGVVLGKNEKRYGWLKSGDTVSISISGIGTLVNQFK